MPKYLLTYTETYEVIVEAPSKEAVWEAEDAVLREAMDCEYGESVAIHDCDQPWDADKEPYLILVDGKVHNYEQWVMEECVKEDFARCDGKCPICDAPLRRGGAAGLVWAECSDNADHELERGGEER